MNSKLARELVKLQQLTSEQAVELLQASDGCKSGMKQGDTGVCPECESFYTIEFVTSEDTIGNVNTCSKECQIEWNNAIFELDDGRTVIKVSELTKERLNNELVKVGLMAGSTKVVLS